MRSELGFYENKVLEFYADFERFGVTQRGGRVILVKNVYDRKGNFLTDHVWIAWDRNPLYSFLIRGRRIKFFGKVVRYKKLDQTYDYKIDEVTKTEPVLFKER